MKERKLLEMTGFRSSLQPQYSAGAAALILLMATVGWRPAADAAPAPPHDLIAANITVVLLGFDNNPASVIVTNSYEIGDFRILPTANYGDYDLQIGEDYLDDVSGGIVLTSIAENNGRGNFDVNGNEHPLYPGTNFATSHIDYTAAGNFYIPLAMTYPNSIATTVVEYNMNLSAAWFRYDKWLAGFARNSTRANGGAHDLLTASPGIVLGTHYVDHGSGRATVNLTSLGVDSRTDGVLLVLGAKNEDNYALSQANPTNGTWQLFSKDNGTDTTALEQDPFAFVFIPKTNTLVVSGRFRGDGGIEMYSGNAPEFSVTNFDTGRYELKIAGRSPAYGVLIISPEYGTNQSRDNFVTYQVNPAGDGWIIEARDLPGLQPALETPGLEPVASFVFIPGATPGISATPTGGLFTTENGGTAPFSVVLHTRPTADVTIGVSSSNTAEGTVSPTTLTFTPADWNVPQTVTITGQDDGAADGAVAYAIVLAAATSADATYNGMNPSDVSVVNLDNDGGFTINPTAGLVTTEAGGTAQFSIVLNQQPTADVTIGLSSSDTTEGTVAPSSLTFNNSDWNIGKTVTVTGVDDFVDDGDVAYTIITAPAVSTDPFYSGKNAADVSLTNQDNDTAAINVTPTRFSVVEAGTTNFSVVLASQPSANVVVTIVSGDPTEGSVSPTTLTFTPANWNTPQIVTNNGVDDLVVDGNITYVITNTASSSDPLYAALDPADVTATTLDNEGVLTLSSGDLTYGFGQAGLGLDGRATLSDPNSPNYNGGNLTVSLTANGTADDRLEVRNTGTGAGQIGVSGSTVSYGGTDIGTLSGGVGVAPLVITLNSAASPAAMEALIRNVTFRSVSGMPSRNRRAISFALTDGDGGVSTASTGVRVGLLRAVSFQEGADNSYGVYTGEADLELRQATPDTAFPAGGAGGVTIDFPDTAGNNWAQVLMRFENFLGNAFGQVPTNAVLVAAELILRVDPNVSNSQGDGSPLYRMLIPFDANNDTWTSLGNGVDRDDIEARSTYDSQLGVMAVSGDSGTGDVRVGVLADIQAWANGETNFGWAMPAWDSGTDAIIFRPGEAANIGDRPLLRILWLPAGTAAESFRQDVDGYADARDTRIRAETPDVEGSTLASAFVDFAGSTDQVLVRFDNIFGTATNQIPPQATIEAAILDLATTVGNGYGDGGQFFAMLQPWDDTNTWNVMVNGVTADGVEAAATPTASAGSAALNPNVCGGFMPFEVTADVQAWSSGARSNYGWAILPWTNGSDGWGVSLSENGTERERPRLRVYYTPPAVTIVITSITRGPASATLQFTGPAGTACSVWRATAVTGPYSIIGPATLQPDGTGSFTDNSPPPGAAFYRVSTP